MASTSRALALGKLATRQSAVASRILRPSTRALHSATPRTALSARISPVARQSRRQYSDAPSAPPKKPGKFRRTLRWTWRLVYLSVLGTIAYVGYEVYDSRHPEPQVNPDPSKKTLVILGKHAPGPNRVAPNCSVLGELRLTLLCSRYRLGLCCAPQETRYGKLQCRRHLTPQLLPLHPATALMYHRHH